MKNIGKKLLTRIIVCVMVCATILGGNLSLVQAAQDTKAKYTPPAETDPFVSNYYVEPINQDAPFFEEILPKIAANIEEYNTHSINPYYDEFPEANNPENFQGLGSTTYANINGKMVTAEAFYRVKNEALHDPNAGLGLLIYQCIQYKLKHPEEDVKIGFSMYRTSATASVCVLPESKYYGYMRSLYGTNYDEHGFVRISYMLTEAARMGIEVTMVNQYPSYAVRQYDPATKTTKSRKHINFETYFKEALKSACYNSWAPGKKVSDFMKFTAVDWTVGDKGTDMQHVKCAAVSHYLATDGSEHKAGVFFGSANLDENNYRGANGNNGSQTGVIISDHEDIYRVTMNYLQLMYDYRHQEGLYELRKLVKDRNVEQIALFNSGKGGEIPKDEQIVYLGGKNDPVFELYFTPFGGTTDAWDTTHNPVAKYINKLGSSEDYVEFTWNVGFNAPTHNMTYAMYRVLDKAYCENANVKNKISVKAEGFAHEAIDNLELGREIGWRSLVGSSSGIHSKDYLISYVEKGVRHRVSLMTSCNFGSSGFYYRTNSLLVINETAKTGGDFYRILADKYSYGMLDDDLMATPSNLMIGKGDTYKLEVYQGTSDKLTWKSSNTSVATVSKGTVKGVAPGKATITVSDESGNESTVNLTVVKCLDCKNAGDGLTFNIDEQYMLKKKFSSTPLTFEAEFTVNKSDLKSTSTLLGSDGNYDTAVAYTINSSGHPKVLIRDVANTAGKNTYTFKKVNVATGKKVHLSIVTDFAAKKMYCYVNGKLAQTLTGIVAAKSFTEKHNPLIGGDHRSGNGTFFPGTIESIAVWSDKRTASEIAADYSDGIDTSDTKLMAAYDLTACKKCMVQDLSKNNNDLERVILWQDVEDVEPVGDYDYSFAIVGDTQTMCEKDPEALDNLYKWIAANEKSQKIEYVIGLGDITEKSTETEWADAARSISRLDGNVPYMLVRGNHDGKDAFNSTFNNGVYDKTVEGVMTKGDLTNSYRTFTVQGTKYLIMSIDFGANEAVLKWADSVIKAHPKHKVIIATHAYMYRDGTTMDSGDLYPPSNYKAYPGALNGDQMWANHFSKHENVLMVLSGHDPWQHIVYRQDEGVNSNTVTQMLIDAQYVDRYIGSTAMVAMFYFSDNGRKLTVRYYSVEKECYGSVASQFTIDLYEPIHTYKTSTTKATFSKNGKIANKCTVCGDVVSSKAIYSPSTIMLSTSEYTYNGKEKKPSVMVKDKKGNVLKKGTDYTVSYESGRKQPGSYAVKVTLKGKYSGSKTVYYKIKPKTPTNLKATRTTSTVTLSWGKVTGADGYRVYLYNENTKKYEKLKNVSGTSTKITGLKPCATYKYKVRAYAKDDETAWSSYSAVIAPAVKKAHTNKVTITDAKLTANGKKVTKCSTCGTKSTETIYSPETIKLSSNKYTYNGKVRTPSITVTDAKGKKLVKDRDYTVFYESGRKNPGRYTVKIKFKGNYTGTKSLTFVIKPKTPASLSAKKTTSSITLSWGKVTGASGYRIYKYNTSTKKYEALKDVSGTSYKIKGLTADTTYKFKVRAYKNDADGTIWGSYSGVFETATK